MEQKTTNVNTSKAIKEFKRIVIKLKDKTYILHSYVTNCLLFYHEKKILLSRFNKRNFLFTMIILTKTSFII